ncbi:hypothetical protein K469DRAFT_734273 [Zopfia rhizophila CBS 207.26]|uniref:Heterokaryon incompatibility domain-containing protein n=1 Tax=Zopfia rhizophila CBS 207.26 TaxID=1314779 RepID=A0A6A6EUR4_9PEZI|nr:hypothetical protein K469DRAFT_734273 [Zopfia rhizophila CBS 207.26]
MSCAMSEYCYSPLSRELDSIRLLRLMLNENDKANIQCELFEYALQESGKATHPYEALSYVWGGSDKPQSIFIDNQYLAVTLNLHTALLHLRDRGIARIIWVDAVCINQADGQETKHQIQSMAKIYGKASRAIVWLGETADDSDGVIQEIAAARHVLITCGTTEVDGYVLCSGLELLKDFHGTRSDLLGPIHSVTYLIRRAIFRPKYPTNRLDMVSLRICGLGELIDMYHTHEATLRHDKVYALLGMSSDDLSAVGLSPDYMVSWKELLQRLVKFLLCEQVSVDTWDDGEMAVIRSRGRALDQLSSNTPEHLGYNEEREAHWTLQATAKSVRKGSLVCLLQGASKPTIIRPYKDRFAVIMIAATPLDAIENESDSVRRPELSQSITDFSRDFLIVWNWEKASDRLQDRGEYETLLETNSRVPEHSDIDRVNLTVVSVTECWPLR